MKIVELIEKLKEFPENTDAEIKVKIEITLTETFEKTSKPTSLKVAKSQCLKREE